MPAAQAAEPEPVSIQLKWKHQFQFAGYYAALEKGFYADEGLDVRLIEGGPGRPPVEKLLNGEANYAVADAGAVLYRAEGKPVVILASIFQHSPQVIYTRADTGIHTPADLRGRRVMLQQGFLTIEVLAVLQHFGIHEQDFIRQPIGDIEDLVAGRTDAFPGYSANEAFLLDQMGVPFRMFRPMDYGIDFYGDTLVTSEAELQQHPGQVAAFRRATIRGWEYALEHIEEIVDLIRHKYDTQQKSRAHLMFEANAIRHLMMPDVVPVGLSNPKRWQEVVATFRQQGLLDGEVDWNGFLYQPRPEFPDFVREHSLNLAVGLALLLLLMFAAYIVQLRRSVRARTADLDSAYQEFKSILDNMQDTYYRADGNGIINWASVSVRELLGYEREEVLGMQLASLYWHEDGRTEFLQALAASGGRITNFETQLRRKDGTPIWVSASSQYCYDDDGNIIGVEGVVRDITEKKQAEAERQRMAEQIQQVQKMESIGLLASGIAHDFNNLLVGVLGNAELMSLDIPPESELHESLQQIIRSARRGSGLVGQMLAYAGKGKFEVTAVDMNHLIRDTESLLKTVIGRGAVLQCEYDENLPAVHGDRNQLSQIIMNLITNAAEALEEGSGTIRIRTGVTQIGREELSGMLLHDHLPAGEYVCVEVEDNGCGMDEATQRRIFDPFFTTKPGGTGLGLAAMLGIVRSHRGNVLLESSPGKGTRFVVYLPLSDVEPLKRDNDSPLVTDTSLRGTVLVVDDEKPVREVAGQMLRRAGFEVMTANDGLHGVETLRCHAEKISLVLLDLSMPRMDGEQAFHAMRKICHDIPIVLSSGYVEADARSNLKDFGLSGFLRKPFTYEELTAKIGTLLASRAA
ncbi:MAG: ABC transporter substrate-binding protein [Mariprofundaceae bacterium]|nr:ABC transporter substrate-binding protein [Mariprofundaceae bacterium]